ncbi:MAG: Asp-tRNA(Asn)/Glu-tRNA(Gln) amidotransferase subunit GatC [Myxococcales bacterium]|nr:Asp-tRNA(Asn)/Glu-tRNA(Gln) amidotransferase subunit GatC [Myxococcales bacterium]
MSITIEEVEHVARLARLELKADETEALAADLSKILDYVAALAELDTQGASPLSHLAVTQLPQRADVVVAPLERATALEEAPRASDGAFAVPQFVEEG